MNERVGVYVVRNLGPNGRELVCSLPVTPEMLQARAARAVERGEKIGNRAVASLNEYAPLGYYRRAFALAHRCFDLAYELARKADALRVALSREIAAPVLIQCAQCGKDTNAADLVPQDDDEDICRACHSDNVEEGNRLIEEDWANYNAIVREGLGL